MQDYIDVIKAQADQLMERVPGLEIAVEWEFGSEEAAEKPTMSFRYTVDYQGQHRTGKHDLLDLGPQLAETVEQVLGPLATHQAEILSKLKCPQ